MNRPNLTVRDPGVRHPGPVRGHPRGGRRARRWRARCGRRPGRAVRRLDQLARSSSSSPASARAAELGALGIPVVADLPGVGQHLQDHLEVYIQYRSLQPVSMQPITQKWRRPWIGANWLFLRRGPGITNHFEGGGFVRGNDDVKYPNLMFHFLPLSIRYDGTGLDRRARLPGPRRADVLGLRAARSRSPRPTRTVHPAIRFNYLSTEQDRREWVEAIRVARSDPQPAGIRAVQRRRDVARLERRDRRGDPGRGSPGTPRPPSIPRAPPGWASTTTRSSIR